MEPVANTSEFSSSVPMEPSSPLAFSDSAIFAAPLPTKRPSSSAGWIWFIIAAIFLLGAPGAAVLWFFGVAAFLVGGISSLQDLSWQSQLITFAGTGVAAILLWQRLDQPRDKNDFAAHPFDSRGPSAFVGRVVKLHRPIVDGTGMVMIGGTVWRVAGRNCEAGQRVKVVHAEGTLLIVDPLET
jgi:membrane protein implicated in regulation of membrane protease activity